MNEKEPKQASNLQAIRSALMQSSDFQSNLDSKAIPQQGAWMPKVSDLHGWYGKTALVANNARSVPSRRDQLEIMQNFLIVDHGEILHAAPQSSNPTKLENMKRKVFKIPTLSGSIEMKLKIFPEIANLVKEDEQLNYVLFNIFNIIGAQLDMVGKEYNTSARYYVDNENPNWFRIRICTIVTNIDFESLLNIWEQVSSKVENFINSLREEFDCVDIDQLNDLIGIEFDSGDQ